MLAFNDSLEFPIVNSSIVGHHNILGNSLNAQNRIPSLKFLIRSPCCIEN